MIQVPIEALTRSRPSRPVHCYADSTAVGQLSTIHNQAGAHLSGVARFSPRCIPPVHTFPALLKAEIRGPILPFLACSCASRSTIFGSSPRSRALPGPFFRGRWASRVPVPAAPVPFPVTSPILRGNPARVLMNELCQQLSAVRHVARLRSVLPLPSLATPRHSLGPLPVSRFSELVIIRQPLYAGSAKYLPEGAACTEAPRTQGKLQHAAGARCIDRCSALPCK